MTSAINWGAGISAVSEVAKGVNQYSFPQVAAPITFGERGIASLRHGTRVFRFRTNPNEFSWNYQLIKRVDQTYGGRVIQLLGCNIDDFIFKADCGNGRWEYMAQVATFMRDVMVAQRNGIPATFEYTTRGWKLRCYISAVPFQDSWQEVAREFEVHLKVQEDVSQLMSKNTLGAELRRLKEGVGWARTKYNDPTKQSENPSDQEKSQASNVASQVQNVANQLLGINAYTSTGYFTSGNQANPAAARINSNTPLPGVGR